VDRSSVPELVENSAHESFRLFDFDGRGLAAFFQCCENFLDLAVNWESARARFRKYQASVHDHVELAGFAGGDFRFFAESGI
jgi:hypothetical protein